MSASLIYIGGLGQNPQGGLDGFATFATYLKGRYGIDFFPFSHAETGLGPTINELPGKLIIVGYSNGGDELSRVVDPYLASIGRPVEAECFIDAKQEWVSPWAVVRWIFNADYPLPKATCIYRAFWGGVGRPFKGKAYSEYVPGYGGWSGHARLPAAREPQDWIEARIAELAPELPVMGQT